VEPSFFGESGEQPVQWLKPGKPAKQWATVPSFPRQLVPGQVSRLGGV